MSPPAPHSGKNAAAEAARAAVEGLGILYTDKPEDGAVTVSAVICVILFIFDIMISVPPSTTPQGAVE